MNLKLFLILVYLNLSLQQIPDQKPTNQQPKHRLRFNSCSSCGELISFDSDNNPFNPSTAGFASGIWIDGSTVFPGVADFSSWDTQLARISADFIANGPGAYSQLGLAKMFSSTNVKYFCNHPNLAWVAANQSTINSIPGKQIQVTSINERHALIRLQVTKGSNVYQQIANSRFNNKNELHFWNESALVDKYPGNYEVLTCL